MLKNVNKKDILKEEINCINNQSVQKYQEEEFEFPGTIVSHRTPVLFCTDRGLHLRTTKFWSSTAESNNYKIQFCDLERWNTNKANTINLNDNISQNELNNNRLRSVRFEREKGWNKYCSANLFKENE